MGMTNAQRQAEYRRRNARAGLDPDLADREPLARLNTVLDVSSAAALTRLATHYGLSKRAMLEQLIDQAEHDLVTSRDADTGTYYAVTP